MSTVYCVKKYAQEVHIPHLIQVRFMHANSILVTSAAKNFAISNHKGGSRGIYMRVIKNPGGNIVMTVFRLRLLVDRNRQQFCVAGDL